MSHRPGHGDALDLGGHGGRFQQADPNRQIELILGIFENHDRRLGHRVEGQSPARRTFDAVWFRADRLSPSCRDSIAALAHIGSPSNELAVALVMRT